MTASPTSAPITFALGTYTFSFQKGASGIGILTVTGAKLPLPYQMVVRDLRAAERVAPEVAAKFDAGECPSEGVFRKDGRLLTKGGSSAEISAMLKGTAGEGSRGGHVVGHTASGKAKYSSEHAAIARSASNTTLGHHANIHVLGLGSAEQAAASRDEAKSRGLDMTALRENAARWLEPETRSKLAMHDKAGDMSPKDHEGMQVHHAKLAEQHSQPNSAQHHLHVAAAAAHSTAAVHPSHENSLAALKATEAAHAGDLKKAILTDGYGNRSRFVIRMHKSAQK